MLKAVKYFFLKKSFRRAEIIAAKYSEGDCMLRVHYFSRVCRLVGGDLEKLEGYHVLKAW